ncbi:sulfotransferase, partial [bacterium]|nr:sulfotransferase [bacterium]
MTMRLPDFFIVGAPKSGTTALHAYLGRHPSIFVPARKEPHFFGSDIVSPAFVRDRDAYLSLFAGATTEARVGEASIWYLYSKRAAREIKEFNPDARIIIMLRNPVDM